MKIKKLSEEIFELYAGQGMPQPCHIEIDWQRETISADYNPEIGGGVPADVWDNRRTWIRIPLLRHQAINEIMEAIKPVANRLAGMDPAERSEAITDLEADVDTLVYENESEMLPIMDAADWLDAVLTRDEDESGNTLAVHLGDDITITSNTSDEQLQSWADGLEFEASLDTYLYNTYKTLDSFREECRG